MKTLSTICMLFAFMHIVYSQQFPERHSNSYMHSWLSCSTATNPNSDRGDSHWIAYDLGDDYCLGQVTIWNHNDPIALDKGVSSIAIDISNDGIHWTEQTTVDVPQATGSAFYQGDQIIDLNGVYASHILITALSNYGAECTGFAEFKVDLAPQALPIVLSRYDIQCNENHGVEINWITEFETGNDHFVVERSYNGIDWNELVAIKAKGNESIGATYNYLDSEASGQIYYRITNVDLDGRKQIFDIKSINCNGSETMQIIAANPFRDQLRFDFSTTSPHRAEYIIETIGGRVMTEGVITDNNIEEIDTKNWPSATYVLIVKQGSQFSTRKLVKS